jgi:Spy/CpxP family protein refolding chaperone
MNSRHAITALVATLGLASSAALFAASPTPSDGQQQPWAGKHHGPGGHMHGGGMDFGFMHALHQLNLTDAQRQSVKSILDGNRDQMRSFHESLRSNHQTLATMTPDDPNYANALAAAKNLSAEAIQHSSDLRVQLYAVLSSDQKKELPQILAKQQSDMKARREQWMSHHQAPQSTT